MLDIVINVFQVLSAILVGILCIPQLAKLIKDKKAEHINFTSFWITQVGVLGGILGGALSLQNLDNVIAADSACLITTGLTIFFSYYYNVKQNKKATMISGIVLLLMLAIAIVLVTLHYTVQTFRISNNQTLILSLIFPALTTLAFTPQYIYSLKTKHGQGVSYGMYTLYVVNNIVGIIFGILKIYEVDGKDTLGLYGGLAGQTISLLLFGSQLGFTLADHLKRKRIVIANPVVE